MSFETSFDVLENIYDVLENIYKRLDPKSRMRMKLCISKSSKMPGNIQTEKKLAVADGYIRKNKQMLKSKQKDIPLAMYHFLVEQINQNDYYAKELCKDIDINIPEQNMKCIYELNNDIINNTLTKQRLQSYMDYLKNNKKTLEEIASYFDTTKFMFQLAKASVATFTLLLNNEIMFKVFQIIFRQTHNYANDNTFIYAILCCNNEELLCYILQNSEATRKIININKCIDHLKLNVHYSNVASVHLLIKYFDPSKDILRKISDSAEETFNVDIVLFLSKYIVDP